MEFWNRPVMARVSLGVIVPKNGFNDKKLGEWPKRAMLPVVQAALVKDTSAAW